MSSYRLQALFPLVIFAVKLFAADGFSVAAHYTKYEHQIPMRDGKRLWTAVYVPKDTSERYPILMTRTPYSVAPYGPNAYPKTIGPSRKFAQDRFIFVYQDVRGRFMSEGQWFRDDAGERRKDGTRRRG
jgi:predicted acyl esterase